MKTLITEFIEEAVANGFTTNTPRNIYGNYSGIIRLTHTNNITISCDVVVENRFKGNRFKECSFTVIVRMANSKRKTSTFTINRSQIKPIINKIVTTDPKILLKTLLPSPHTFLNDAVEYNGQISKAKVVGLVTIDGYTNITNKNIDDPNSDIWVLFECCHQQSRVWFNMIFKDKMFYPVTCLSARITIKSSCRAVCIDQFGPTDLELLQLALVKWAATIQSQQMNV